MLLSRLSFQHLPQPGVFPQRKDSFTLSFHILARSSTLSTLLCSRGRLRARGCGERTRETGGASIIRSRWMRSWWRSSIARTCFQVRHLTDTSSLNSGFMHEQPRTGGQPSSSRRERRLEEEEGGKQKTLRLSTYSRTLSK